jgi:uncharacterized protein
MAELTGDRVLMRIHIGESDKFEGKPLYECIVELLRSRKLSGATVLRGILGFGASAKLHTDRFVELSMDLPMVVECIETQANIDAVLPQLERMIGGGVITLAAVTVVGHRAGNSARG